MPLLCTLEDYEGDDSYMKMRGCPGRTSRRDEEASLSVQEPSLVEGGLGDTKRSCWEPGS